MTDWLRRAGHGRLPDGRGILWSVAEGARGRRWRWTLIDGRQLVAAGLVECDPSGAFGRLELATAAGALTFHPDRNGREAHGNVAAPDGVRPIAVAWQPGWGIGLDGDPFGSAVAGWSGSGLRVGLDLAWLPPGPHPGVPALPTDARGVPELTASSEWPLEA